MSNIEIIREIEAEQLKATVDEFAVGDTVKVKIISIDRDKQKVGLTMKL